MNCHTSTEHCRQRLLITVLHPHSLGWWGGNYSHELSQNHPLSNRLRASEMSSNERRGSEAFSEESGQNTLMIGQADWPREKRSTESERWLVFLPSSLSFSRIFHVMMEDSWIRRERRGQKKRSVVLKLEMDPHHCRENWGSEMSSEGIRLEHYWSILHVVAEGS